MSPQPRAGTSSSTTAAGAPAPGGGAGTGIAPPGPVARWVLGARPRTLPAAIVPVVVGTAAAHALTPAGWSAAGGSGGSWWRALGALVVALAIQVATNYANDYSDGIRGTDEARVGPLRLVASGLAAPGTVKRAAFAAFGVAAVVGLVLAAVTSWWVLLVGAACFAAGWFYTGGPRPYGYAGYGEVFVFVFFGLVATEGTYYVQTGRLDWGVVLAASVAVGLLSVALLLANNLRDIETDRRSGKRTLVARIGRRAGGWGYVACVGLPFVGVVTWAALGLGGAVHAGGDGAAAFALLPLAALPVVVPPVRTVLGDASGRALLPVLAATGKLQMAFGGLLAAALLLWRS